LRDRYRERLAGVLSCYDRIIVTGTLPGACYAKGMTAFLWARRISVFDYPRFAEPLRDRVRERAAELASAAGVTIEHIAKSHIRQEDVVAKVLAVRGDHPGLLHIISAMEACDSYKPWHDKRTHRSFLRPDSGKCLHYYFYFIDAELGLIYLRVPTWCPFRLQFYCNRHRWLARRLTATGIGFTLADNAFLHIDDWQRAQTLADHLSPADLHRILDRGACPRAGHRPDPWAQQCCPVLDVFAQSYHWSFMQVEYATDLVFRSQAVLKSLYEQLSRQAILTVKAEQIATFLGHKITPQQGLGHPADPGAGRRRPPRRHPLPAASGQGHALSALPEATPVASGEASLRREHARADGYDRERLRPCAQDSIMAGAIFARVDGLPRGAGNLTARRGLGAPERSARGGHAHQDSCRHGWRSPRVDRRNNDRRRGFCENRS
jgi:hypothetical protein